MKLIITVCCLLMSMNVFGQSTYSQILFRHIGGLIESKNNVLYTFMPIFN